MINISPPYEKPITQWIDPLHPFLNNLILMVPLNENIWNNNASASGGHKPFIIWGKNRAIAVPTQTTGTVGTWNGNVAGTCLDYTTADFTNLAPDPISSDRVTVCVVRRKKDTTARNSALFGENISGGGGAVRRCGAHVPFSDGNVYWDFGGTASPNRLTVTSLSLSTRPEFWVFTAGSRGSAIYRNGIKLASQATAVTRTVDTGNSMFINAGNGASAGDSEQVNFIMFINEMWNDEMAYAWMANPWAFMYPDYDAWPDLGTVPPPPSSTFPALTVAM